MKTDFNSYVAPYKENDYDIAFECNGINFPDETILDIDFLEANSEKVRRVGFAQSSYPILDGCELIPCECSLLNLKADFCIDNRNAPWKLSFTVLFVLFEDAYSGAPLARGLILQDRQFKHRIYFYDVLQKKLYSNYSLDDKELEEVAKCEFGENFLSAKCDIDHGEASIVLLNDSLVFSQTVLQEFSKLLNAKDWQIAVGNEKTEIKFELF